MYVATAASLLVAGTFAARCTSSGVHVVQPIPQPGLSRDRDITETALVANS